MYTGLTGALQIWEDNDSFVDVGYISGWSINDETEIIETTKLGKLHKDAYTNFQSWGASADGAVVFSRKGGHEALFRAKHLGKEVKLRLFLNDRTIVGAAPQDAYFEGYGLIESLSVSLSAEDKGSISIGMKGIGELDLIVDGKNVKTEQATSSAYFMMKVDEAGNLIVITDEDNAYKFSLDEDKTLKVLISR